MRLEAGSGLHLLGRIEAEQQVRQFGTVRRKALSMFDEF
jgi:hypothetical protein